MSTSCLYQRFERIFALRLQRMSLTDKQRNDMHSAMLDYLRDRQSEFPRTFEAFKEESGIGDAESNGIAGLLEKKWTSVVRLQRKVIELEAKLQQAEADLASGVRPTKMTGDANFYPRAPARYSLTGHRMSVFCVAVHPVYSLAASGSEDTSIRVWDFETGQYERTLSGHTGPVHHIAFDATGALMVSCSSDMNIKLWDFNTYECTRTLRGHEHNISCVKFMPAGDQIVSCSRDNTIKFWEVATGFCLRTLQGHSDWVRTVAVSHDGSLIASGSNDQTVRVWNASTGVTLHTLREHTHVVESVAFPQNGVDFATSTLEGASRALQDGETKEEQAVKYVASASRDRTVRLWSIASGACLMTFTDHENWVRCVVWHPSSKAIISCSDDKSIRVFDLQNSRCARTIEEAHSHFVTSISMSPRMPALVSGSVDKAVNVWDCR